MKSVAFDVVPEDINIDLFEEANLAVGELENVSDEDDYGDDDFELIAVEPPRPPPPEFVDVETQCDLVNDTAFDELLFEVGIRPEEDLDCDCSSCEKNSIIFQ